MNMPFDLGLNTLQPLSPETAVRRGHVFVTVPVIAIILGGWGFAVTLVPIGFHTGLTSSVAVGVLLFAGPIVLAWLWWSYFIPRWRYWALSKGVDPVELQRLAQESSLVWPKGHYFERTEFRYRPPDW